MSWLRRGYTQNHHQCQPLIVEYGEMVKTGQLTTLQPILPRIMHPLCYSTLHSPNSIIASPPLCYIYRDTSVNESKKTIVKKRRIKSDKRNCSGSMIEQLRRSWGEDDRRSYTTHSYLKDALNYRSWPLLVLLRGLFIHGPPGWSAPYVIWLAKIQEDHVSCIVSQNNNSDTPIFATDSALSSFSRPFKISIFESWTCVPFRM